MVIKMGGIIMSKAIERSHIVSRVASFLPQEDGILVCNSNVMYCAGAWFKLTFVMSLFPQICY